MCGIAGYFSIKSDPPDETIIKKMTDSLAHRGPDDQGIAMFAEGGLGHRRLSILDLSRAGHQPMYSSEPKGRYCIVFNGEIYNFHAIRDDLALHGIRFRSNCDTEVLLSAYCKYGEKILDHLIGQFTFAIWDDLEKRIFIAVDRFSIKQVYYFIDDKRFIFASEVKALLAVGVPVKVNQVKLLEYQLLRRTFGSQTFFQDIKRVPAGSVLTFNLGDAKVRVRPWYFLVDKIDPERMKEYKESSINELVTTGEELLCQSVNARLLSDAPLGIMCSGGVDSSLVTVLAVNQLSNKNVAIYTAGIPEKDKDETAFARAVCDHLGVEHRVFKLEPSTFLPRLPQAIYQNDEPLTFGNALPMFGTCDLARNDKIKVLITGEGADELFGGYRKYQRFMVYQKFRKLANFLPKHFHYLHSQFEGVMDAWKLIENGAFFQKKIPIDIFPGVKERLALENVFFEKLVSIQGIENSCRVAAYMDTDIYDYLGKLLVRQDRMGMWASVECRVPYLDHRVVEFAMHLPLKYKMGYMADKILLRAVAKKRLPEHMANRPKKGFKGSASEYIRTGIFKGGFYETELGIPPIPYKSDDELVSVRKDVWKFLNIELWGRMFVWNQSPNELAEKYCQVHHSS